MSPPNAYPPARIGDPFGSTTNLTAAPAYHQPSSRTHFVSDATAASQTHLMPSHIPANDGRSYKKLDDEKGGSTPNLSRNSSYDIINQMRAGEEFDTRNATEAVS